MAAARQERIDSGQVVPADAPTLTEAENITPPPQRLPLPLKPAPGAIEAGILLVNDVVLTLPEVLYPLRERIAEACQSQSGEPLAQTVQRMLEVRTQQDVGAVLIHKEALARLSDPQRDVVADAIEREVHARISREFGDSSARFEHHLARCGLTLDQYRASLEREIVSRQYAREKLLPQIFVRRDELLTYYRRNLARYSSDETRELWMIEAPFEAFLPPGTDWSQAPENLRAQARLRAARHIHAAHEALANRPFEDVAREYSRGVHAAQGGLWGEIGRPLQPPYDQVTKLIFGYAAGQHSAAVETERGWCIARCGQITPATRQTFTQAQDDIRARLTEQKFERLSSAYMMRVAGNATVTGLDDFIRAGVRRILTEQPAGETQR